MDGTQRSSLSISWQTMLIGLLLGGAILFIAWVQSIDSGPDPSPPMEIHVYDINAVLEILSPHIGTMSPAAQIAAIEQIGRLANEMAADSGGFVFKADAFIHFPDYSDVSAIVAQAYLERASQ